MEMTPDKEYQGKLKDVTSFGGTIYAFTLVTAPDEEEGQHVGPFEFDRPIDAYVGQQVAIRVSAERTEMGIFSARIRWLNPKPIDRKGGKAKPGPTPKGKGSRRSKKGGPRKPANGR